MALHGLSRLMAGAVFHVTEALQTAISVYNPRWDENWQVGRRKAAVHLFCRNGIRCI